MSKGKAIYTQRLGIVPSNNSDFNAHFYNSIYGNKRKTVVSVWTIRGFDNTQNLADCNSTQFDFKLGEFKPSSHAIHTNKLGYVRRDNNMLGYAL